MATLDKISQIIDEAEQASSAGDHSAAEQALRRALELQEASVGPVQPDVANTLNKLGTVCEILGRPNEAEFLYRRALGIARRTLTRDHPYFAISLQNLSNLYQAQGEPEKLVKMAAKGSPRPILSDIDSATDEAAQKAEAHDTIGLVEAQGKSAPARPKQSGSPPPDSRSHSLYERLTQPTVVLVGMVVVILSVLWLLFSENLVLDPLRQNRGDTRLPLKALADGQDGVGEGQVEGFASTDSEPLSKAYRATHAAESGQADLSAMSSANRMVLTVESSTAGETSANTVVDEAGSAPEPATSRSELRSAPAVPISLVVVDAEVCSELVTRSAENTPLSEWRCRPVTDLTAPGPVFFYTRIRSLTSTTVTHRWFRNGVVDQGVDLQIGANDGPGYRTYSIRTVSSQERGAWRVELWDSKQELFYSEEFVVR